MTTMLMKTAALSDIFIHLPTSLKCTKKHTHSRSIQINEREQSENEKRFGGGRKDEEDK
jgi:hypothetical protein